MEAVHDPRARLRRMHEVLLERRPATEMRASAARPLRCCMRLVQRVWGGSYLAGPASGPTGRRQMPATSRATGHARPVFASCVPPCSAHAARTYTRATERAYTRETARAYTRETECAYTLETARAYTRVCNDEPSLSFCPPARPHALTTVIFDDDGEDLRVSAV